MPLSVRLTTTRLDDRITPRAGDLDPTFGTNGVAAVPGLSSVTDAVALPDGRVYVAGVAADTDDRSDDMGVVRLTAAGVPDPTFGTNGLAVVPFRLLAGGTGKAVPNAVAVRPDGGVVLAGYADVPAAANDAGVVAVRAPAAAVFTPAGVLDAAFKADGKISFAWGDGLVGEATDVAVRPDGRIVLAGLGRAATVDAVLSPAGQAVEGASLLANGQFDPGFDGDGKATRPVEAGGSARTAAVAADGGVYGLLLRQPTDSSVAYDLVRLTPAGAADAGFGTGGVAAAGETVVSPPGSGRPEFSQSAYATLTLAGGLPTVAVGNFIFGLGSETPVSVRRFRPDGRPDPAFGTGGEVPRPVPLVGSTGLLSGLSTGQLLVVPGTVSSSTPARVDRLANDGTADATFGTAGSASLTDAFGDGSFVAAVAPTPSGGAVVVRRPSSGPTTVVRLLGDDPLPDATGPIIVGSGTGGLVQSLLPTGVATDTFAAFPAFTGAVRTATADFTGDGVPDLVVGTGPGAATAVRVLDGATRAELFAVAPFEAAFTGGVYVAAGDLDGDGKADLLVTPDEGGGPRVDVYRGAGFGKFASFFGIDDPAFRGGARASTGDLNGDGRADLVVAAGFGGGPRVAAFDGRTVGGSPQRLFGDFFAFEEALRNGVFVAAGDIDGDGFAELVAGGGPGGGPRVTAFGGKALLANGQDVRANFFGGDATRRDGVRVAVKNLDGDARADLVVGVGDRVTGYFGRNIAAAGTPAAAFDTDAFPGATAGVFVG